jgi:peptidoglycan/LPS O-acetylase OafA/YrhL
VKKSTSTENLAINAIRAIAASLVVVGHIRHLFFVDYSQADNTGVLVQAMYLLGSLGHPAVIVFFVLSGFWVGGSVIRGIERNDFSLRGYASARLVRLWIVLIPAVLLTQVLDRVGTALFPASDIYAGSSAYHGTLPADGAAAHLDILTTLGNVFFIQAIHVDTVGDNTPLWSLSYEFWYYLLFPAGLLVFARSLAIRWRVLSCVVFVAGAAVAGPAVLILLPTWLLGALISWKQDAIRLWWPRIPRVFAGGLRVILTLALLATSAATIASSDLGIVGDYTAAIVAGLLLISLVTDAQSRGVRASLTPLSWAAGWSYSLYATHLPVIALIAALVVPRADRRFELASLAGLATGVVVFVLVLVAGFLFWALTERNTTAVRRRFAPRGRNAHLGRA